MVVSAVPLASAPTLVLRLGVFCCRPSMSFVVLLVKVFRCAGVRLGACFWRVLRQLVPGFWPRVVVRRSL